MCEIIKKLRRKSVSGYKIVAHKDGSFYSTFTGQKYEIGKPIEGITDNSRTMSDYWTSAINHKLAEIKLFPFFNKWFVHKTAVFLDREVAFIMGEEITHALHTLYNKYDIVLVKMTLTGDIYSGEYDYVNVYAGTQIKAIEILHTFQKQ